MISQSREIRCVWKPGFLKSGHIYGMADDGQVANHKVYQILKANMCNRGLFFT